MTLHSRALCPTPPHTGQRLTFFFILVIDRSNLPNPLSLARDRPTMTDVHVPLSWMNTGGARWVSARRPGKCRGAHVVLRRHRTIIAAADDCIARWSSKTCAILSVSRFRRRCICCESPLHIEKDSAMTFYVGANPKESVPVDFTSRRRRIALQVSGFVGKCKPTNVVHHVALCRRFFECDVFLHTWSTTWPTTPHWSHRPRPATTNLSLSCLSRLRDVSRAMRIDVQQPPTNEQTRDFQAHRMHGWNMNLLGMSRAAALRAADSRDYDLAIRLRPDGIEAGRGVNYDATKTWDCVARMVSAAENRHLAWSDALTHVHPCASSVGFLDIGSDNCFLGPPAALDRLMNAWRRSPIDPSCPAHIPECSLKRAGRLANVTLDRFCHADAQRYSAFLQAHV